MGSGFIELFFIPVIAVSYFWSSSPRESKALYFDHQSSLVLLLCFYYCSFSCLMIFLNKITALGLWVLKEESYFRFNDFYIRFINVFVSHCLQEEKAKSSRACVDGLHMFGWLFLQRWALHLVLWCFWDSWVLAITVLFSFICNSVIYKALKIEWFFLFYLVAWTDLKLFTLSQYDALCISL